MTAKQQQTREVAKMLAALLPEATLADVMNSLVGADAAPQLTDRQGWVAESLLDNLIELAPAAAAEAQRM